MNTLTQLSLGQYSDKGRKSINQDFYGALIPDPLLKKNLFENHDKVRCCAMQNTAIQEGAVLLKPDAIIFYESEPGEELLDTVRLIQASTPTPIIIFTDQCGESLIANVIEAGASSFVVDSMKSHCLRPIIEAGTARFKKCQMMKGKLTKTEQKLDERRDIERAKFEK